MRTMQALVLIPGDPPYDRVRQVVSMVLRERGVEPVTLEQSRGAGMDRMKGTDAIQSADLIVADATIAGPHVLYELGFAHALRKPVLLLWDTSSRNEIPADLTSYQMLFYNPGNLDFIEYSVTRFLEHQQSRLGATL
jgi:nucleoside 2-deoxyribosyltransferase